MWFDAWADIGRIAAVGAAAYVSLVLVLRLSGKRTLAKLNAFDFVVTVALGSTLATILLNTSVSWLDGVVALGLLAALQWAVAWLGSRVPMVRKVVASRPSLLVSEGELLEDAMRRERVTAAEVNHAVRASGRGGLEGVAAVVLETDGTLSVIGVDSVADGACLRDVPTEPGAGRG